MAKIIAIAFSDLHLHKFKAFAPTGSERLQQSLKALDEISKVAEKEDVPLLFTGDLFHDPKEAENETMALAQKAFYSMNKRNILFYAISGNHDLSEKNTIANVSPSHLDSFTQYKNFYKVDNTTVSPISTNLLITGIPYYNSEKELIIQIKQTKKNLKKVPQYKDKFKILMLHSDMPNAKTPTGQVIGDSDIPEDLDEFFKFWDLVLCGHIHKAQKLSKKVYMLGSPIHQTAGDEGNDMGYWEVYSNGKMKFIPLKNYPQFITVPRRMYEEAMDQLSLEGREDYVVVIEDDAEEEGEVEKSEYSTTNNIKDIAEAYCRDTGVKDKKKIRKLIECLTNE